MFKSLFALATISSASALTVITRSYHSDCVTGSAPIGAGVVMSSILPGCSDAGYADCTAGTFAENSTDGLLSCPNKKGSTYNITGICTLNGYAFTCGVADASPAASVTLFSGLQCNGSALALGVIDLGVCSLVTPGIYVKMWTNTTGSFVATYTAAGCPSSSEDNHIAVTSFSSSGGCVAASLGTSYNSVKYTVLQTLAPTAAPASNNTNTTSAPVSSGSFVVASLASAVVAAASLML